VCIRRMFLLNPTVITAPKLLKFRIGCCHELVCG
jgi:hypothetical protein